MTKVCHMTSVHPQDDTRIFHKECTSLARAGYEVYLVSVGGSYDKNGVHVVGVGQPPKGRLKRILYTSRRVYEAALALDADIYHFHDPELLPYGMKLKKLGKKVIFDSHEFSRISILKKKKWIPKPLRAPAAALYARYEAYAARRLDAVITVTPSLTDYFKALNPLTVEITNYPVFEEFPAPAFQEKRLVFAGMIVPEWNHHVIVRLLERFPDCRYDLCGKPDDQGYIREMEALPGWKQVDYHGQIPHKDVPGHLQRGSAGLAVLSYNPATGGNQGTLGNNKIFEEMMAGLPVVCTDFVLWKAFIEPERCGICVNPSDEEAIASAIRYLLDHPEEARQMGENGRRVVKERFNWGVEEKLLLALYQKLLNGEQG